MLSSTTKQRITVCHGSVCTTKGGGCPLADILRNLSGDHEVVTVGCMHRCANGPNARVDRHPAHRVAPTEQACRKFLTEASPE